MEPTLFKATVLQPVTIDGEAQEPGTVVEVDEHTLRNLVRKGRLEAVTEKKKKSE